MSEHRLIPDHAIETLREQDAARAKARENADPDQFRRSFIATYAQEIEMIRRGAIVTQTVADVKRLKNLPILEGDETRPAMVAMPDGKPVPTLAQARRTIFFARLKRFFRRVGGELIIPFLAIKNAWRER